MQLIHGLRFNNLRGDIYGGLTAAVVALPLALAFGVASGAGPVAGLYGAIFVGFFAALFGATPSQISGLTGPMTVVILDLRDVAFLDSSATLGLEESIKLAQDHGKHVFLLGARPDVARTMKRLGVIDLLPDDHHHITRLEALQAAAAITASLENPA